MIVGLEKKVYPTQRARHSSGIIVHQKGEQTPPLTEEALGIIVTTQPPRTKTKNTPILGNTKNTTDCSNSALQMKPLCVFFTIHSTGNAHLTLMHESTSQGWSSW